MKTGTKCRLKYMPETFVIVHAKRENIIWVHYLKNDDITFPVPLSELEPIQEWPKTWEELGKIHGYYHSLSAEICKAHNSKCLFATQQQAESALAMAQLSQLHRAIVGDWEADWSDTSQNKYCIVRECEELKVFKFGSLFQDFPFQTKEQAEFSLLHHRELWEKFNMILWSILDFPF
jgi:hypothetical protein